MGKVWHPELELLSAIADGELGADEGKYARLHVAACEACTSQVAAFTGLDAILAAPFSEELAWEALKRDLATLPSGAPSLRTDLAIAAMVREPRREPARVWQPFPLRGLAIRGAAVASIVLAIVIGLIPTGEPPQQAQAPDPKAAFVAGVQQAVLHTKSNTLYVLKTEEAAVDAVNASTYERRALINVGGRPISLTLNKATDVVLVLDAEAKLLTEIDANQNKVVGSIPLDVEGTPTAVVMNETTGKINVVTSIPNPPGGPRPAPTGTPAPTGAEVAVLDPVTKKLEHLATLEVAPRLVVPHPAGQQTLLVSPDATTVVDASYRPIVSLAGGISAAFDLKRDWFAVLSAHGTGSNLTFVGDGAPTALAFEGQPAAVIPMPEGGFAVLAAKAQGEGGRIFVIDASGRLAGITDVDRTGDLDYDARADRFTVASAGTVASVARPSIVAAPSPSAPASARPSAPASVAPSASPSADPTASDIPNASASPSASVPAAPSVAPTADPRVIASLPTDAAGLSTGQYRLELPSAYAPVVTATGASRVWFVDQRNGLDALDTESGTVYRIAALPRDAEIKALGVGPEYAYAADPANGRLFLLDIKTEELSDYPLPAYDVTAMTVTPGGVVWMSVPGSPQLLSFTPLSKQLHVVDIKTSGIVALEADGPGRIWFSTGNGLGYYEPAARRVTNLAWTGGQINELLAGSRDTLWVATATGLIYSVKDGSTITPATLVGRPVTSLALDARDKPWYLAPASGGAAFRAVSGGQERSVSGPAVGLALNSQGRAWLFDPQGGFVLELGAAR